MLCISMDYAVRLSVCLSCSWILLKRIKHIFKIFFYHWVAHHSSFFVPNIMAIFHPDGGIECRWIGKNSDSQPVSGSIMCCEWFDYQVQYTHLGRTMANWWYSSLLSGSICFSLFMTRSLSITPQTAEQHLIICSGKSEAEVTIIKDFARRITLLKLTTDRHKALCGLFATCLNFVYV